MPAPAPASVPAPVPASSYIARSNQYQHSALPSTATAPSRMSTAGGYAARSQMMSNNNPVGVGAAPAPTAPVPIPSGHQAPQQSPQQHPVASVSSAILQSLQQPIEKPVEPSMEPPMEPPMQQYGEGHGDSGLMHGRYYGSSIQSFESQRQSQPLQEVQTAQTPIENNTFVSSDSHQSHQQMTQVTVQAPAPIPAQPEMFTPVTSSSIVDATSSAVSSTIPVEQSRGTEEGMGAPRSVNGRVTLLNSALSCNLPGFLVDQVLENPALPTVKDPTGTKVHAVALLKLLESDPAYGAKIGLILDSMEAWKKYKLQDHSLFITGAEQKTDYFLLDQGGANSTKLLTLDESKSNDKDGKSKGRKGYDTPEIPEAQETNDEGICTEAENDDKDKHNETGDEEDGGGEAGGRSEADEAELD
mmetsp:Transcript_29905/g.87346  ORF Transcript_29905/g.87346 Transcript_29905/m.87346 type:complete len:415 (+) Transcript_29905:1232-2476(+)